MITYDWKVPNTPLFNSDKSKEFIAERKLTIFSKITPIIQTGIKLKTPVGATTTLRNSIMMKVTKDKASVFTNLKYAIPIHDGRRAAPVARSADASLDAWIRLSNKGRRYFSGLKSKFPKITVKQAIFLLKRGKKQKPTKGQPFFDEGLKSVSAILQGTLQNLLKLFANGLT